MGSILASLYGTEFKRPQTIAEYFCEGCQNHVKVQLLPILGGANKGQLQEFKIGCKCPDKALALEIEEDVERLKKQRYFRYFDQNSLMNNDIKDATFENYKPTTSLQEDVKEFCMLYAEKFTLDAGQLPKNLLLHGDTGIGKTHLAIAILKVVLKKQYSGLFISLPILLTMIKNTYSKHDDSGLTVVDILKKMKDIDLLVIDDLGAEAGSNHDIQKIFELLDSRLGKPTIFTTNLNYNEFSETFGKRNTSRILKNTIITKVDGEDYRKKDVNLEEWL
ncbi:ATP-binding protein [Calidifontibacillus oryziterrae]|uniref:ATP-binding protein n=1 Tax=Calidifontibacillus oryziterrae TaxID=1191699 RepID=UPI001E4557D7|nr:ATP-binding protein [Calidifontibacillus oryziterrae]